MATWLEKLRNIDQRNKEQEKLAREMTYRPQADIESLRGQDPMTDWALGMRERTLSPLSTLAGEAQRFKGLTPQEMGMELVGGGMAGTLRKAAAKLPSIDFKPESNFLSAKSDAGLVGGHIRDGGLYISHAEVDPAMRGKGEGVKLYKALVDEAQSKGLKVYSDSTVEAEAARMYEALKRRGYDVQNKVSGTLEGGAVYGKGAKEPAFYINLKDSGY